MKNIIILVFAVLLSSLITLGQKLPNVQKNSLWAPANIKIDGKADEWADRYQAYNNATDIYYNLSNDGENIYLTIMAKQMLVIDKIIRDGISFTINHTLKKKDEAAITITYPVLYGAERNSLLGLFASKVMVHDKTGVDYSLEALNNIFATKAKMINIKGIENIPDDDISVYNDQGIKAVSKFDKPLIYIYELAVPLKYLAIPNNGEDGFSYHIKMNVKEDDFKIVESSNPKFAGLPPPPLPNPVSVSSTDFWGEYTLAKKP